MTYHLKSPADSLVRMLPSLGVLSKADLKESLHGIPSSCWIDYISKMDWKHWGFPEHVLSSEFPFMRD